VSRDASRKGLAFQPGHTAAAFPAALAMLDPRRSSRRAVARSSARCGSTPATAWPGPPTRPACSTRKSPSLGVVVGRCSTAANPVPARLRRRGAPLVTRPIHREVARQRCARRLGTPTSRPGPRPARHHGARARSRASCTRRALGPSGDLFGRLACANLEPTSPRSTRIGAQYLRSMQRRRATSSWSRFAAGPRGSWSAAPAPHAAGADAHRDRAGLPDVRGYACSCASAAKHRVSTAAKRAPRPTG